MTSRKQMVCLLAGALVASDVVVARGQFGVPISDPAPLNTNAATDSASDGDAQAEIATDGSGNWVAVWTSTNRLGGLIATPPEPLFSRSTDNGLTWTDPAPVKTTAGSDVTGDGEGLPRIVYGSGTWVVIWASRDDLGGTIGADYDILVARSTDNGATWTDTAALNTTAATDGVHSDGPRGIHLATDGLGNWVAAWASHYDLGGKIWDDLDILVAHSADNGATWSAPTALNSNAATDSGIDWFPHIATDGVGNWVTIWSSEDDLGGTIGPDRDLFVARSTDNGATWTDAAPLNGNAATDAGFDEKSEIATDGLGKWVAVWRSDSDLGGTIGTDTDILVARSTDNGATWTYPEALNTNAAVNTGTDGGAVIVTDRLGNWVVVWSGSDDLGGTIGPDWDILVSRSTNNGVCWTDPIALNTNAAADSGDDDTFFIGFATDGAGNWVVPWTSDDDLGGTIGMDHDVLVARFFLLPCPPACVDCVPCDTNCDGDINALDIEPFIGLLFDGDDPCCGNRCDIGSSGDVNLDGNIDALDIVLFLECLFR